MIQEAKEYVLIQSKKLAEIKYKALQKRAANLETPLSEASIEATAVIEVINYMYENNEWMTLAEEEKRTLNPVVEEKWENFTKEFNKTRIDGIDFK